MKPQLTEKSEYRVGILADTHGHLNQTVVKRLGNVDLIIHAGDIDSPSVLPALEKIAPLVAVRGNMDFGPWAADLPQTETVQVGRTWIYILHDLSRLDLLPESVGFGVVISGHTHRSQLSRRNGTLYINPGSVTYPRHPAPASMAFLLIRGEKTEARLFNLDSDRSYDAPL
ncbi:MAG: metallophosphoesterase [Thermodesulfobacteriota bacterium]|nr:metallophosphoesterase [Thermodesulfobacteriota bacterium]